MTGSMTQSLAHTAIALLIDLAERGEINPWDVQVIEVIDRFLKELPTLPSEPMRPAAYEADLSRSGQAFLYASMLVLLKADTLMRLETAAEDPDLLEEALHLEDAALVTPQLPLRLEQQLRRRAVAQPLRRRQVTLQELIQQLESMATTLEGSPHRVRPRRPRPPSRQQTARAITQLAHQENLTEVATELEQFLAMQWQELPHPEAGLEFEQLLERWTIMHPPGGQLFNPDNPSAPLQPSQHDRVALFWALLLLASQSKVELTQTEFYQDLQICPLHPTPTLQSSE